jgi:hypothetical protein
MAGKKTFVAGEVLLAQDVNDFLMDQTVMNFATSAARASAIPTPTEGMTSYISTTGTATIPQIEVYTGSAWETPYGYTLLSSGTLSGAADLIMDNVTSDYRNYRFLFNGTTSTQQGQVGLNLRNSTGNLLGANYAFTSMYHATNATTLIFGGSFGNANGTIFGIGGNSGTSGVLDIQTNASNPTWQGRFAAIFDGAAQSSNILAGGYNATVSGGITGIRIFGVSCTLTGTYQLYGARK